MSTALATGKATGEAMVRTLRAMATEVTLRVIDPEPSAVGAIERAARVFGEVERTCTRFDPASPLMQANANREQWHAVPAECYAAIAAAADAYRETGGLFDPRVLDTLEAWGYDRSLPFRREDVTTRTDRYVAPPRDRWQPEFDPETRSVRIGAHPVDLGGIAKGLAVRWAAAELAGTGTAVLVDAGGDAAFAGSGPDGNGWRVGVEDPRGDPGPLAVLSLSDRSCATSSVRVRHWRAGDREVHHLVDPRSGFPGGDGLLSVTVVGDDPARAEVWTKALFLGGPDGAAALARERGLAAMWVDRDGAIGTSIASEPYLIWRHDRA